MTQKWWVLSSVACGTFMATLDSSIVNIALPTLTKELGPNIYQIKWVVIIYLLVITCLLLPFGRLSDQKGRKFIFQLGFLVFIIGSALCSFAPYLTWLVVFRAVQAIGASMLMANGPAIITSTFSAQERGTALGVLAMVVSAGLLSGPSIGGFLIAIAGWRSIFWINIPIGLLGITLVHQYVRMEGKAKTSRSFDWTGALLQTIFLVLFTFVFNPPHMTSPNPLTMPISKWIAGTILLITAVLFIKVETRVESPLFDLVLLRNQTFWTANLAGFLTFVAFSSIMVLMPFFLEEVQGFSPQKAGLFMTSIPLTIFVVAPISGRLSDRMGSQGLSFAGACIGAVGLFAMAGVFGAGIDGLTRDFEIIAALSSMGFAQGLFQSPNNNAIMGSVPVNKLGVASAMLATMRNLGLATGTGIATSLFSWRLLVTNDLVHSFHAAFLFSGIVAVGAMLALLGRR